MLVWMTGLVGLTAAKSGALTPAGSAGSRKRCQAQQSVLATPACGASPIAGRRWPQLTTPSCQPVVCRWVACVHSAGQRGAVASGTRYGSRTAFCFLDVSPGCRLSVDGWRIGGVGPSTRVGTQGQSLAWAVSKSSSPRPAATRMDLSTRKEGICQIIPGWSRIRQQPVSGLFDGNRSAYAIGP